MVKKISIPYFHKGIKYVTPLIFGCGVYLFAMGYYVWGILLFLIGIAILTTKYITEIDLNRKFYKDYLFVFGMHIDEDFRSFEKADRIVITKGDYSQMLNARSRSRQLDWVDYSGTVIFDDASTLTLLTKIDKEELVRGLKEFAQILEVGIEDQTTHRHYWIDLSKF